VAYSFHNNLPLDAFADTTATITSADVLWGDTIQTVGAANNVVHINTNHLRSQVIIYATVDPILGASIDNISGVSISHTNSRLIVQTGVLHPESNISIPVTWPNTGSGSSWTSNPIQVFTNGNAPIITINSVTIGQDIYSNGPYTVNYSTPLVAGKDYILNLRFTKQAPMLSLSTSDLTFAYNEFGSAQGKPVMVNTNSPNWVFLLEGPNASDFTVTKWDDMLLVYPNTPNMTFNMRTATLTVIVGSIRETVNIKQYDIGGGGNVLYLEANGSLQVGRWGKEVFNVNNFLLFGFGSVVGFDNYSDPWDDFTTKFNPTQVANTASLQAINYYSSHGLGNAWKGSIDSSPKTSDNMYHNLSNVLAGKGDPCRLVGMTPNQIKSFMTNDQLYAAEKGWRAASAEENARYVKGPNMIWQTWTNGNPDYYYSQLGAGGTTPATYMAINGGTPADPHIFWLPAINTSTPNYDDGEAFPAPGGRIMNGPNPGVPWQVGKAGYYYSNTPFNATYVYALGGDQMGFSPVRQDEANAYFTVRCVYIGPPVSIPVNGVNEKPWDINPDETETDVWGNY
jgi:hypothetical protein